MYIKIYFNDKPLFLCDQLNDEISEFARHDDAIFIDEFSPPAVNSMVHEMHQAKVHAGIFLHPDFDELKKAFWRKFSIVIAAGGLVFNEHQEMLFIFRRGKWDLPKGKMEKGETPALCAVREVEEETGLTHIAIGKNVRITYHTYTENGKQLLKESHWFEMKVKGRQHLVPQIAEDIHQVKWVSAKEAAELMKNSFPSIKEVVAPYLKGE